MTFKEEIIEILRKEVDCNCQNCDILGQEKATDQIIQSLLNRFPKEKEWSEELIEEVIDAESYLKGYNDCLKQMASKLKA